MILRPPAGECADMDVGTFYPEPGAVNGYAKARATCSRCQVITECLEYITAQEDRGAISAIHGYAAGQRHTERRATRTAKPGTPNLAG